MKDSEVKLTLQETEELCRLYMDCRLSVLEETELQYVLGKLPYSSPVIDEVRALTGIVLKPQMESRTMRRQRMRRIVRLTVGVAASVALIVGIFFSMQLNQEVSGNSVIAYENGERLSQESAEAAVEASIEKAETLLAEAREIRQANLEKESYFINLTNTSK